MTFIWPVMLVFVLLAPLLAFIYLRIARQRAGRARQMMGGTMGGAAGLPASRQGVRGMLPPVLFFSGLLVLLVALARPQAQVSLPHVEGTVILAFDVSGSMAADDLKPTRMDAARAAAQDFVNRMPPTVQIGVVGFSDSGFAIQPPSNNPEEVLAAINRLAPQRGTSLGHGIEAALNAIAIATGTQRTQGQAPGEPPSLSLNTPAPTAEPTPVPKGVYTPAAIILLTDGDNNENPDPIASAQAAADRGVRIYTVGIGSPAGTSVHVNGFTVHTQLDEALLQQIAQTTGGAYYNATDAQQLRAVYDHLDPQLFIRPEKIEITALFAGASILMLLAGGVFSLAWFNRLP